MRLRWLAVLAFAIAATVATAQPPRDAIGPDDVRRVGDWLKGMNDTSGFDPELLKQALELLEKNPQLKSQVQEFKKTHPQPNLQQFDQFKKQLEQSPALKDAKAQADLKQALEKFGGLAPSGVGAPSLPPIGPWSGSGKDIPTPGNPPTITPTPTTPSSKSPPPVMPEFPSAKDVPKPPQPTGPKGKPPYPPPTPIKLGSKTPIAPKFNEPPNPQKQQYQKMAGWWEKNVGPLQDSPAVQQLIMDFANGSTSSGGQSGLGNLFGDGLGGESSLGKLPDVNPGSSNWKLPDLGLGKLDFSMGDAPSLPDATAPSLGSGGSFGEIGAGGGSWLPVVFLAVAAGVGLLLWWIWPKLVGPRGDEPRPIAGLGPWPVDPRSIADRAALIKAFEYLSVLRCGTGAKVWNHLTIAAELRRVIPDVGDRAEPLARLYALARYTPGNEPLAADDLAEARAHLCRLAGVSP